MNEIKERRAEDMTPAELGGEIRTMTRQARRMVVDAAIQIGYMLQLAKEKVEAEGAESFVSWVERETEYSKSGAYRMIKLYTEYGSNQGSILGVENAFPTLGKVSISNALSLLAVPEGEREEFAETVNAEAISNRELEAAIREKQAAEERAKRAEEELRQADEGAALRLAEALQRLDEAREEKIDALRRLRELENRPTEVAVRELTEEELAARLAPEIEAKTAELETARKVAEEKLRIEKDRVKAAEEKEKSARDELDKLKTEKQKRDAALEEANRKLAETAGAEKEIAELKKKLEASDGAATAVTVYIKTGLNALNAAIDAAKGVEDEELREKLKNALWALCERVQEAVNGI